MLVWMHSWSDQAESKAPKDNFGYTFRSGNSVNWFWPLLKKSVLLKDLDSFSHGPWCAGKRKGSYEKGLSLVTYDMGIYEEYQVPLIDAQRANITKTRLCNFDPLKPHFYIVKLGFTGVYIIFLISAQKHRLWYSLEPPRRGGSNEYPQSMF